MLQKLRQYLTLALIAVLPFHAFLVTVGTRFVVGPDHAPLSMLAVWKEAALAFILLIALIEIIQLGLSRFRLDEFDIAILGLLAYTILKFVFGSNHSLITFMYGFKYDFVPLVAFVLLRRVPWSDLFFHHVKNILIAVGSIVALLGIASLFLPQSFFTALGYSDLHSLYRPDAPLAAFQQIGGTAIRRMQSTMSGPNQLGIWLLIPLSFVLSTIRLEKRSLLFLLLFVLAIALTLSRSAILAAGVLIITSVLKAVPLYQRKKAIGSMVAVFLLLCIGGYLFAPQLFLRAASTRDHLARPLEAVARLVDNRFGYGLGTAGPASNRLSSTCVFLEAGEDPSWASERTDLCVFVGGAQVQPLDRRCECPFLPENWYLQIGLELGVIAMLIYCVLIFLILKSLQPRAVFYAFLGVSIAALFLHAWEDAAVAYTVWILVASVLPVAKKSLAS